MEQPSAPPPTVGILAVQGDYLAHAAALRRCGIETRTVRRPAHLHGIAGLVLPGGESTTMLRLLQGQGLEEPLRALLGAAADDRPGALPVLATCAGLILLAREVSQPTQRSLDVLDLAVARNGYGRQIASGTFALRGGGVPPGTTGVFIRAPRIQRIGADIEVLAWRDGDPVLVRKGAITAACFHPELEVQHPVTLAFAAAVRGSRPACGVA